MTFHSVVHLNAGTKNVTVVLMIGTNNRGGDKELKRGQKTAAVCWRSLSTKGTLAVSLGNIFAPSHIHGPVRRDSATRNAIC
jgi:hypothetical protein